VSKNKVAYVCNECGADYSKWQGQCSECGAWNAMSEVKLAPKASSSARNGYAGVVSPQVETLDAIAIEDFPRITTHIAEFDRVLGGGVVPGSVILIGGHPGAGKSTLLLQMVCQLAQHKKVLYVSGEESLQQIALRASRLNLDRKQVLMLADTHVVSIIETIRKGQFDVVVIDSIQVMYLEEIASAPGSVSQVRESAAAFTRLAKDNGVAIFLVGHVTKDGALAGPKVLEHIIDATLMLEGSADQRYRTLRGQKNRFGAVNEIGVFAMVESGLKEVKNPSAIFLSKNESPTPGTVVSVVWEGTRPLLVEIQALVDSNVYGQPRRVTVGLEQNRLAMLLAVLHRHGGLQLGDQDVFVNAVGGVKIAETSVDLALLMALISSFRDQPLPEGTLIFGEVGLTGEIRPVPNGESRLSEAVKHGFGRIILPAKNRPRNFSESKGIEVIGVAKISEAMEVIGI